MAGVAEVTWGLMARRSSTAVNELHGADVDNYLNLTSKGRHVRGDGDRQPARHPTSA